MEIEESKLESIKDCILNILQDKELQTSRMEIKKQMWQYQRESGKRIVDFLTEIKAEAV